MTARTLVALGRSAFAKWNYHEAPRLGAALAYYTLLSTAPLMVLIVAICSLAFDQSTAEQGLLHHIQPLIGTEGTTTIKLLLESAHQRGSGILATGLALLTLLWGASSVFVELRSSLNTIWGLPRSSSSLWSIVTERLASFAMVLALGVLLLLSLLLSTAFTVFETFFSEFVPLHAALWSEVANVMVTLFATAFLCSLIFRYVPDARIALRDVAIGAVVTSILFTIGKALLALYIGTAAFGSTYGAAGSLVAFVVWVYYSSQIFLFGAVFTRVYADAFGSHAPPHAPRK